MIGAIIGDIIGSRFNKHPIDTTDFELFTETSQPSRISILTLAIADGLRNAMNDPSKLEKEISSSVRKTLTANGFPSFDDASSKLRVPHIEIVASVSPCIFWGSSLADAMYAALMSASILGCSAKNFKAVAAVTEACYLAYNGIGQLRIRKLMEKYYDMNFYIKDIKDSFIPEPVCSVIVPVAIKIFLESSSLETAIRTAISLGGTEAQYMAAIAGALACEYWGSGTDISAGTRNALTKEQASILDTFENEVLAI